VQWIRRHIAQVNPDVVHALWLWDNAFDAWLTGVRPRVMTAWGSDIREIGTLPRTKQLQLMMALRFADAVTSGSKELLELCQARGAKPDHCYLIGVPGIDLGRFDNPASRRILYSLGVPDGAEVILSCRAMQPFYRIHTIVSAFQYVHQQRPGTVLLILNFNEDPPGYLQQVKRQIQEAGLQSSVQLLDAVPYDQMPELYMASSVMVSIPENDGMPQSVYEAMAADCPIVASDLTTYDGIIDDGQTGLRVPGDDPEQVAQAILRILQDNSLRQRLVANGRQVVRERGDIHREMAKMEQLYYDLMLKLGRLERGSPETAGERGW